MVMRVYRNSLSIHKSRGCRVTMLLSWDERKKMCSESHITTPIPGLLMLHIFFYSLWQKEKGSLQDVHIWISGTCEYVALYGKRNFADVRNVEDLEMGRSSWTIWVSPTSSNEFLKEPFLWDESHREMWLWKNGQRAMQSCWLWSWKKGPWAKKYGWFLGAGIGKKTYSPLDPPEEMQPHWHLNFNPERRISELWPTKL